MYRKNNGGSSSGRTTDSDSVNPGSNPGLPAMKNKGFTAFKLVSPFLFLWVCPAIVPTFYLKRLGIKAQHPAISFAGVVKPTAETEWIRHLSYPSTVIPAKAGHVVTRSEAKALTISAIQSFQVVANHLDSGLSATGTVFTGVTTLLRSHQNCITLKNLTSRLLTDNIAIILKNCFFANFWTTITKSVGIVRNYIITCWA